VNLGYGERRKLNAASKEAIAKACAATIPNNCSIIMNLGTTTEAVARALLTHRNITVVTNNLNVANILVANGDCEIIVAGGTLRRSDGGLVGDLTTQFFEQFKVDFAVIGASALDGDGDLLDYDFAEVRVSKTIIKQARSTLVVCDGSKMSRSAPMRLASLGDVEELFTDLTLSAELNQRCLDWGTKVNVVNLRGDEGV
jgi:DeoR family glycerol-3-phosphate regulon repressor